MPYVDGFLVAVPKDRVDEYEKVARTAGEVWREYGALSVIECVADDVPYGESRRSRARSTPRTTRP